MTWHVIRNTDGGAVPNVISSTTGTLITTLDYTLVTVAGWTKNFSSGSTGASYRQAALGGNTSRFYLNVDDNGPGAGGAKEARVRGFEDMTAYNTGTNLFPTAAQATNGYFVRKSTATATDGTIRPWVIGVDERTMYMFIQTGDTAGLYYGWMFGDFFTYLASDPAPCLLIARDTENSATVTSDHLDRLAISIGSGPAVASASRALARATSGAVGALIATSTSVIGDSAMASGGVDGQITYTNPADNLAYLADLRLTENTGGAAGTVRGRLRGLEQFLHATTNASNGDVIPGTNDLSGRSYLVVKSTANSHILLLESSNTVDTN